MRHCHQTLPLPFHSRPCKHSLPNPRPCTDPSVSTWRDKDSATQPTSHYRSTISTGSDGDMTAQSRLLALVLVIMPVPRRGCLQSRQKRRCAGGWSDVTSTGKRSVMGFTTKRYSEELLSGSVGRVDMLSIFDSTHPVLRRVTQRSRINNSPGQ
jgi:hypothetical protein